jgi:hypothetical protein
MHPEIQQDHPGNCPKCGMELEAVIPDLDREENLAAGLPSSLLDNLATSTIVTLLASTRPFISIDFFS